MTDNSLFARHALLPEGWRRNVRLAWNQAGELTGVQADSTFAAGEASAEYVLPGMVNLHSHTFQRALGGLTEKAGDGPDSFWTWRDLMYRFARHITPEHIEAIAAQLFAECLRYGYTAVCEFHYVQRDAGRRVLCAPGGNRRTRDRGGAGDRHRHHHAAGAVQLFQLRRKTIERRPEALSHRRRRHPAAGGRTGAPARRPDRGRRRPAFAARRLDRADSRTAGGAAADATAAPAYRRTAQGSRRLRRLERPAPGAMAVRAACRSISAGAWCTRPTWAPTKSS